MQNSKGFTLIELSVVLVIVSFILGCIYRGSEMLIQSKLTSVIKDMYKYQTSFNLFKTQYNAIPGDFSSAGTIWGTSCSSTPSNCNGNGNNYIETASGTSSPLEDTRVFQHLYLAGILTEAYSGGVQSGVRKVIGTNLPIAKYPLGTFEMVTQSLYGNLATYLEFASLPGSSSSLANGPILNAKDAYYIDKKIDDGLASSGLIYGGNSSTTNGCTDNNFSSASASYLLSSASTSKIACVTTMILSAVN